MGKVFNRGLSKENNKEGLFKSLDNIKNKNEELINTINTINRATKNIQNTKDDVLTYNIKYSFARLKNIDDIKKLSLDFMFNLKKDHHKKLNSLINLKPRIRDNKNKRLEFIIHASDIYNKLYYIYKNKYDKEIDSLRAKNKKKLDYKQLKISDDYWYTSDEEQEEQKKQNKKPFNIQENIEWRINQEDAHVNKDTFKKYFQLEISSLMYKVLRETNDKKR